MKAISLKQVVLFLGDVFILYFSLLATLFIRYQEISKDIQEAHFQSFTILFLIWVIVFYIVGFYEIKELKNNADFGKKFTVSLLINFALAIALFYFIPAFGIAPKTNLFIFLFIFGSAYYGWRTFYNNVLTATRPAKKMLLVGDNQTFQELAREIKKNSQLGYEIKFWLRQGLPDENPDSLFEIIRDNRINLIVIPRELKKNPRAARPLYKNFIAGVEIIELAELYSIIFGKVPIEEIDEAWVLENLGRARRNYDAVKRPLEILLAVSLGIICLPFFLIIAVMIKANSAGSAFFTQKRIGLSGRDFVLWKFRTMQSDAEKSGPKWAKPNDKRITPVGKFLRQTHLDELPQLINIFKGELSLVGPRPERPEFVSSLEKEIPYYDLRHLVKPGLTGWAQLKYRYGASVRESYEKMQYDIFYLKNRSFWLDLSIIFKTIKRLFAAAK